MVAFNGELLQVWIISLLWPLTRILGMIAVAPIFSDAAVPNQIKLGLGLVLTLAVMPMLPPIPHFEIFSPQGLLLLTQQLIIGLAIGFSIRMVFAAVGMAGQLIGMGMGLGFAMFYDPQSHGQSTAVSQFLTMLAMLMFLSLDGHLMMVSAIAESFLTMPIALEWHGIDTQKIVMWGESIFSTGLLLALPSIAALLITNMALGILTRTAPQLNLFGIGFPITLSIGFLVLALSLDSMRMPLQTMIQQGVEHMHALGTTASSHTPRIH